VEYDISDTRDHGGHRAIYYGVNLMTTVSASGVLESTRCSKTSRPLPITLRLRLGAEKIGQRIRKPQRSIAIRRASRTRLERVQCITQLLLLYPRTHNAAVS
jgi:hypothetical protein